MRCLKMMLTIMLLCLLPFSAAAQDDGIPELTPIVMPPQAQEQLLDLYCGPTQGFYRHGEQTLNLGKPYAFFGQYDCWAMVAQDDGRSFGPIGWVEAGFIPDIPYEPQLSFEDGFAAMVEEDAPLTDNPLAADPFAGWAAVLPQGTQITVLAQLGDWLYVQAEIKGMPVRAFIMKNTVF